MKASEFIKKYVKRQYQKNAVILGLINGGGWYHIHRDEEISHTPVIKIKEV